MMRRAAVGLGLALLLAGCGVAGGEPREATMTVEQAGDRLTEQLERIARALPGGVDYAKRLAHERGCYELSLTGQRSTGRVHLIADYRVQGISAEQTSRLFSAVRGWPQSGDYRILASTPEDKRLLLEHRDHGTRVELTVNDKGVLHVGLTSPCVWPEGTPAPRAS